MNIKPGGNTRIWRNPQERISPIHFILINFRGFHQEGILVTEFLPKGILLLLQIVDGI